MNTRRLESRLVRVGGIYLVLSIFSSVFASNENIILKLEIHPRISANKCSETLKFDDLRNDSDFEKDLEFPKILAKGWVSLENFSFDEKREFYPCIQNVKVQFPSLKIFHEFLLKANACVNDFGADYELFTSAFEYVARKGDIEAYKIILLKDDRNSASEASAPLYSILRRNPRVFSKAFASLSKEQKQIAVQVQYDFNLLVEEQKLEFVKGMSAAEKRGVLEFNS